MKKTRAQLKAEMVEEFEREVDEVLAWQEEHPKFRLIELEEYLLKVGQKITSGLAKRVVEQKDSKQPVEAPECETCGQRMRYKGQKRKRVISQVGEVEIERGHYWCRKCGSGVFPPG